MQDKQKYLLHPLKIWQIRLSAVRKTLSFL